MIALAVQLLAMPWSGHLFLGVDHCRIVLMNSVNVEYMEATQRLFSFVGCLFEWSFALL